MRNYINEFMLEGEYLDSDREFLLDAYDKIVGNADTKWSDIITSIQAGGNYVTYLTYDGSAEKANEKFKKILDDFGSQLTNAIGNGWSGVDSAAIQAAKDKTYTLVTSGYGYDGAQKHDHREYASPQ